MYQVSFEPSGKNVEVESGVLLHEAIMQAGMQINLPCGGQGRCGHCKVLVKSGNIRCRAVSKLSRAELEEGWVLACQSLVEGDCLIHIPPQEAIERRLPGEKHAVPEIALPVECDWREPPLIRKYFVSIEPPSLEDNTTDLERLKRELARQHGIRNLNVSLPMMRRLARALREADWGVTAVLETGMYGDEGMIPRLLDLCSGDQTTRIWGAAIDIGTTSNVVYLCLLYTSDAADE